AERNQVIRERYVAGESLSQLARAFGISFQRVQQIIKHRRK
ncbi:MAG: helix-turn-helix domain-containing protein, partial [Anaerolineae bacterium]|nr:helix-turn-helix domain-containing protein [Anaerolineae bacterium]